MPITASFRGTTWVFAAFAMALTPCGAVSAQTTSNTLVYDLSPDKDVYAPGESVNLRLSVRNSSGEALTLHFPSSQRFDFVVRNQSGEVWRWSAGKAFLTVVQSVVLNPGQVLEFTTSWDQRDSQGLRVPSGAYEVVGLFLGTAAPGMRPAQIGPVSFQISPAPVQARVTVAARRAVVGGSAVGEVIVAGRVVLRIRAAAGGLSSLERAERVAARLRALLAQGLDARELTVGSVAGEPAVLWRNQLVVTADVTHAGLNNTAPQVLADVWREQLAAALTSVR